MGRGHFLRRDIEKSLGSTLFLPPKNPGCRAGAGISDFLATDDLLRPPPLLVLGNDWWSGEMLRRGRGRWERVAGTGVQFIQKQGWVCRQSEKRREDALEDSGWHRMYTTGLRGAYVGSCCAAASSGRQLGAEDMAPRVWLTGAHCVCALHVGVLSQCPSAGQLPAYCALTGHPRTRAAESQRSRAAVQPCAMEPLQLPRNYECAITNPLIPPPFPPPLIDATPSEIA